MLAGGTRASDELAAAPASAAPTTVPPAVCRTPVDTAVPDCPVRPASPEPYGHLGVVPPGYTLDSENREAVPTGTAARIDTVTRRYTGPGGSRLSVDVSFGDLGAETPDGGAETLRMPIAGVRPRSAVIKFRGPEGRLITYTWRPTPRVRVEVAFLASELTEQQQLAVVTGVT